MPPERFEDPGRLGPFGVLGADSVARAELGLHLRGGRGERDRGSAGDLRAGIWPPAYLAATYPLSALGSFGGRRLLPARWDSVAVVAVSLAIYAWAVRSATAT